VDLYNNIGTVIILLLLPKYITSIGKIKNKITNFDGLTRIYFPVDAFTSDSGHDDFKWHFVDFDDR